MDDPTRWPQWVYYADGYQAQVDTPEALVQMWPNHADRPNGPFPGIDLATLPWEPQYGPFAPNTTWQQYGGFFYGRGGIYACKWLLVDQHVYGEGEILPPPTTFAQEKLLRSGDLAHVPAGAQPVIHASTGRVFLDPAMRDAYDKRYRARDLSGLFQYVLTTPDPETTPRSRVGRPPGAEWDTWTFDYLLEMLKDGWRQACAKHPEKKRPSFDDVAACVKRSRKILSNALQKYHHTWETIRPFLVD